MARGTVEPHIKTLTQGRNHVLRLAALVSVLVPVWFAIAALGTKFGLWGWHFGLVGLTAQGGTIAIFTALFIALAGLYAVLVVRPMGGWALLGVAFLVPIVVLGVLGKVRADAAKLPPIHDIATNPAAPVPLSQALMSARGADANEVKPLEENITDFDPSKELSNFAGRSFADLQREAYPDIKTLNLDGRSPADAYAAVKAAVMKEGWTIVTDDAASGVLEATDTTFWYGFKDDIAIKVTGTVRGSTVDARSISRVGKSDLGKNAARLRALLAAVG